LQKWAGRYCYPDIPLVLLPFDGESFMAMLARIAPELPSANLDDALAYYEQKLGFEVTMRLPGNA
jgi:hypothetical protein